MNRMKIKVIAGVLVVFLLGFITGVLGTGIFIRHRFRQFTAGENSFQTFFMRRLKRELKLTDSQQPEVEKILKQTEVEVRQFLMNSRLEFDKIVQRRNEQLKEILTPAQQKKLDEMHERIKKNWHLEPHHQDKP